LSNLELQKMTDGKIHNAIELYILSYSLGVKTTDIRRDALHEYEGLSKVVRDSWPAVICIQNVHTISQVEKITECIGKDYQICMKVKPTVWETTRTVLNKHYRLILSLNISLLALFLYIGLFEAWWWRSNAHPQRLWVACLLVITGFVHYVLYKQTLPNAVHMSPGVMTWTRSDVKVTQPPILHGLKGSFFAPPVKYGIREALYRAIWYKPAVLVHRIRLKQCAFTICNMDLKLIPKGVLVQRSSRWYTFGDLWNSLQPTYDTVCLRVKNVIQNPLYFNPILIGHIGIGECDQLQVLDKDEDLIDCWDDYTSRLDFTYKGPIANGTETWMSSHPDTHRKADTKWLTAVSMTPVVTHRTSRCITTTQLKCTEFRLVRSYIVSRNLPILIRLETKLPTNEL
jgi:hypothetical protein